MKLYLIFLLFGLAFAQEGEDITEEEVPPPAEEEEPIGDGVVFDNIWPQNSDRLAGAIGRAAISTVNDSQVCTITFPTIVALFHCYDCFFLPGSNADRTYQFTVPPYANDTKQFGFVVNFKRNAETGQADSVNATDITLLCGSGDTNFGVSSFPADMDQDYNNMIVMKRDGYHTGDVVMIDFPTAVANLSVNTRRNETVYTTANSDGEVTSVTLKNFVQAEASGLYSTDENKQVHIGFNFVDENSRFHSSQVTYSVSSGAAAYA